MDFERYGIDVWQSIFLRCDYSTLASMAQTCRFFGEIINNQRFWLQKCEYEGISPPPLPWRQLVLSHDNQSECFDYRNIYMKRPFGRILLPVLRAEDTMEGLEERYPFIMFENGDNVGFRLEKIPKGCVRHPDIPVCLATSETSSRYFEIYLEDFGVEDWVMDKIRPKISVSEMQACRHDCAAQYIFQVQLLKENEQFDCNKLSSRFFDVKKQWNQWQGGQEWETVTVDFTEYPIGIRKIGILTKGRDLQWWRGNYGPKFANTQLIISFPEAVRFKEEHEFDDDQLSVIGPPEIMSLEQKCFYDGYRPDSP